tara:strand:- start:601 stop:876 length:276 start_codon:yes stop_codon:yes gene_type:complete
MKRWMNLHDNTPWYKVKRPQDKDFIPSGPEYYKKGSFHNKVGMTLMWIFYVIVGTQVVYALSVIPFWPIPAMMAIALVLFGYVVWTARNVK